jgi:hypothetical protein
MWGTLPRHVVGSVTGQLVCEPKAHCTLCRCDHSRTGSEVANPAGEAIRLSSQQWCFRLFLGPFTARKMLPSPALAQQC